MACRPKLWLFATGVVLLLGAGSLACSFTGLPETSPSGRSTIRVRADEAWTDTGMDVEVSDVLSIEYVSGDWSPWPGGSYDALGFGGDPLCDCNVILGVSHAALIGRIGGGRPFFVGAEYVGGAGEAGRLYLGINDTRLEDNSGRLRVRVEAHQ